jgi:hypothetical protein
MVVRCYRLSLVLAAWAGVAGTACADELGTLRVLYAVEAYANPAIGTEGTPGVFYVQSGTQIVYSITAQGKKTPLAKLPANQQIQGELLGGPDERFYSFVSAGCGGTQQGFSIGRKPDSQVFYPPQSLIAIPLQNMPDGTFLGSAAQCSPYAFYLGRMNMDGEVTTFYQFPSGERSGPVTYATDGNYYAVAWNGGDGTLFRLTPSGAVTNLQPIYGGVPGILTESAAPLPSKRQEILLDGVAQQAEELI